MKLGVWARIGVAASLWWMALATPALHHKTESDIQRLHLTSLELCLNAFKRDPNECAKEYNQGTATWRANSQSWRDSAGLAALLLSIGLVFYTLSYWTVRWVLAGRRKI